MPSSSPSSSGSPNYPSSSSSSSSTTTNSGHSPLMSDEDDAVPPSLPPHASNEILALPGPPLSATRTPSFPIREDCWSEEATRTLVDCWGSHYLELNRGSIRQQQWQEVADAVNALHAHSKKLHRTDIQCKNRIDTLKKKYKVEKYKSLQSHGRYVSTWPFFKPLDSLIGDNFVKANTSPSHPATRRSSVKNSASPAPVTSLTRREPPILPPPPSAVPVGRRSKRPTPMGHGEEANFRRNFSAMAAAAAAARVEEDDGEDSQMSSPGEKAGTGGVERRKKKKAVSGILVAEGYMKLAQAIGGFAEIYERVEEAKQKQMVELEKQRMQFAKDLEIQRMKLFMESQVQLEKLKRSRRNSQSGEVTLKGTIVVFFFE